MLESKIVGYKKIFGFVLPDWISEKMIKTVVAGMLLTVVMLLVLTFVVWPNFETVKIRSTVLDTSKTELQTLRSSSQGLSQLNMDLSKSDQDRILSAMPTLYSPESAIYLLRRVSADTGVTIISYSLPGGVLLNTGSVVGTTTGGDMVEFATFPVRIVVSAPVDALLQFISKIEASLPFGVVSDLNLQEVVKLSKSVADKDVQLAMEISFFQSTVKTININKLQTLSTQNLTLAKELAVYNYLVVPETAVAETATASGARAVSIFGF